MRIRKGKIMELMETINNIKGVEVFYGALIFAWCFLFFSVFAMNSKFIKFIINIMEKLTAGGGRQRW